MLLNRAHPMAKPNARRAGLPFKSIQSALEFNSGIIIIHLALNLPGCKHKREKHDVDSIGSAEKKLWAE